MDERERDEYISRIISGYVDLEMYGNQFKLYAPNNQVRKAANKFYNEMEGVALMYGLMDEDEMLSHLVFHELWDTDKQNRMDGLVKDIEELKLKMFSLTLKTFEREGVRNVLRQAEKELKLLKEQRHQFDYVTAEGFANIASMQFIILSNLYDEDDNLFYEQDGVLDSVCDIWVEIMGAYSSAQIHEPKYREFARTDPWRSHWNISRSPYEILGKKIIDLTDEQKCLCHWSKIYDNVYEHPEAPHQSIVEDDDMLDGWFIFHRNKNNADKDKKSIENLLTNSKIKNADEVYIVVDNPEAAKKVESMNDIGAIIAKKKKYKKLFSVGEANELDLPDVRERLRNNLATQSAHGMKERVHGK